MPDRRDITFLLGLVTLVFSLVYFIFLTGFIEEAVEDISQDISAIEVGTCVPAPTPAGY